MYPILSEQITKMYTHSTVSCHIYIPWYLLGTSDVVARRMSANTIVFVSARNKCPVFLDSF